MNKINLRTLREEYDISALRIAKFMKVSEQEILNWENGVKEPSVQQLRELASLFDISLDGLSNGYEEDKKSSSTKEKSTPSKKGKIKRKTKKKTKYKTKNVDHKTVEKKRNWPLLVILLLLIGLIGAGGYLYWQYGDEYSFVKKNSYTMNEIAGTFTSEKIYEDSSSSILLKSDGTYQMKYNDCSADSTKEGTWTMDENSMTLTSHSADVITFKILSANSLKVQGTIGCSIQKGDVFTRGSITSDSKEGPNEEEEGSDDSDTTDEASSYIVVGQWSGNNSTLHIKSVDNNKAVFTLQSYDPSNSENVASLDGIEGSINANTMTFDFKDDGYGNSGTGSIVFDSTQAIFNITFTTKNEEASWSILQSGTLFK
ncbi:helix-turn-helix transcriptional regulator [Amedibacillus sp. YH-ame6]